ncbi:hypothetical protein C8R44DRAFT_875283 [Mycena epipterygia]|nr:hypothetical protein C8R44DRAFT_875283 [Mycena epipterygia]
MSPEVWGITSKAWQENCGVLRQDVAFSPSAISIATWLLPWVALIAQLPFEATGWMDLLSGFLCIGSPALAAYSLLRNRAERETHKQYQYMVERGDAAAFILQGTQQCPMRANQRNGELASLIVLDDGRIDNFLKTAAKDFNNTHRGFTYSFLAQGKIHTSVNSDTEAPPTVLLTFLTYLISFIAAVLESLGSPTDVTLQFAGSTVITYLQVPNCLWVYLCSSQDKAGSIKAALTDSRIMPDRDPGGEVQYMLQYLCPNADLYAPLTPLDPPPPTAPVAAASHNGSGAGNPNHSFFMEGAIPLVPRADGLVPSMISDHDDNSTQPLLEHSTSAPLTPLPPPTWWGFDVCGDERREGPIFTYERIFTSFACTEHVRRAFAASIENFRAHTAIPKGMEEVAKACGLQTRQDLIAFTAWSRIPAPVIQHMLGAAIVALFLQWGTTGAAIFVAYNTPTVGLGCRSGSYLIYGIGATMSWAILVFSHLVSYAFMQRLEHDPERPWTGVMSTLAALALFITRFIGKAIAISNALWLFVSSILEDLGTFNTCWCETAAFQYGEKRWTPVFKGPMDLRETAGGIWIGGFILSIVVSILVGGFFAHYRGD